MKATERILGVLEGSGADRYGDEAVSQLQHALQCAHLAECSGATASLVVAALLHDFGHLIHKLGEDAAAQGIDDRHEALGRNYLARWVGEEVTGPVGLHVDAKRYLCATEPAYFDSLSPASVRSLELQGGPFSDAAAAAFIARPYAHDALAVRRWDEQAKDPKAFTPNLDRYRPHIEALIEE